MFTLRLLSVSIFVVINTLPVIIFTLTNNAVYRQFINSLSIDYQQLTDQKVKLMSLNSQLARRDNLSG